MRILIACLVVTCCLIPALGFALDLVEYSPLLSHYEVLTTENIVLVFDDTLNPATVSNDTVWLETRDGGVPVPISISLGTTYQANDTVVLDPSQKMPFGVPLRIVIGDLYGQSTGIFSGGFAAGDWFVPNVPTDLERPVWDPSDFTKVFVNANVLLGFNPLDPESTNPAEPWRVPGIGATEAWKIHTGRPDIIVASLDTGFSPISTLSTQKLHFSTTPTMCCW